MFESRSRQGMLILGLLVALLPLHPEGQDSVFDGYFKAKDLIERAVRLLGERKLNDAKSTFEKAAKQVPGHYEAHFYLAQLAYENKDYASALEHVRTAIHSLDELDQVYKRQSVEKRKRIDARRRERQERMQSLKTISGGEAMGGCAKFLFLKDMRSTEEPDRAKASSSATEDPFAVPAVYHFVHGNCLLRLKRNAEAREQYARAIQADPQHADSWNNLVYLWFTEKNLTNAQETIRQAEAKGVAINPALKKAVLDAPQESAAK